MLDDAAPVRPGDLVDGKYRVESILGAGGMGVVVRAVHEQLARPVALKFLRRSCLDDQALVARFEREARATARLKSEHVIDILDVGRLATGEPFLVMELLEGTDLAAYLSARGRLGVAESVEIMLQICDGIAEAHASGIIHRDLKPQNVFLVARRDGRQTAKVLDFGIAKVDHEVDRGLTSTTDVLGSPLYMSPEQLHQTRDVGPASDVWALGVMFYEMLSGSVPFDGETIATVVVRISTQPHAPIGQLRRDVPPWLSATIDGCLVKDASARLQSVDALANRLRAGASASAVAYTPAGGVLSARPSSPKLAGATADMLFAASSPTSAAPPSPTPSAAPQASSPSISEPRVPVAMAETMNGVASAPRPAARTRWIVLVGAVVALGIVITSAAALVIHKNPSATTTALPSPSPPASSQAATAPETSAQASPATDSKTIGTTTAHATDRAADVADAAPPKASRTPATAPIDKPTDKRSRTVPRAGPPPSSTTAPAPPAAPSCQIVTQYDSEGQPHFQKVCK